MKWDIEYLDFKGESAEIINYRNIVAFEKEIQECFNSGVPIKFKYVDDQKEIER